MSVIAPSVTPTTTPKFHFSLWVADLPKTIAFYRVLFGQEPHKEYVDYAKFELAEPPLVVSFLPQSAPRGASLNHVGLRLPNAAALIEVQHRLEQAGFPTIREDGVECCYALQTKFWVTDPDGVRWEVYTVHGDLNHHGKGRPPQPPGPATERSVEGSWTHTLPDPFPARIPAANASLDEVQFMNSFNAPGGSASFEKALAEAWRVLRPGGRLFVRGLVGDRPYPGVPDFPGLSAKFRHVPMPAEPLACIAKIGFRGAELETWKEVGCIKDSTGVAFRVVTAVAWKTSPDQVPTLTARYEGPFATLTDDDGITFVRGVSVPISLDKAEMIRNGPAGPSFVFESLQIG